MAMAPYTRIDFSNRLSALRDVGQELGLPAASIPSQSMANSSRTYLKYINIFRVSQSLAPLPSLDYTGFVPALNVLAALTSTPLKPENTTQPFVSGLPQQGAVLTCNPGVWTGSPTFAYQWKREAVSIGTNSATYTVVAGDIGGHTITCIVTATNAGGAGTPATSNPVLIP